jgi:hypothetical protein
MVLRRQEPAQQTPRVPLLLLLGSIALDGDELSSRSSYLRALAFEVCGTKSNEHKPLFVGIFK